MSSTGSASSSTPLMSAMRRRRKCARSTRTCREGFCTSITLGGLSLPFFRRRSQTACMTFSTRCSRRNQPLFPSSGRSSSSSPSSTPSSSWACLSLSSQTLSRGPISSTTRPMPRWRRRRRRRRRRAMPSRATPCRSRRSSLPIQILWHLWTKKGQVTTSATLFGYACTRSSRRAPPSSGTSRPSSSSSRPSPSSTTPGRRPTSSSSPRAPSTRRATPPSSRT
mmetsp:Transcript_23798/g.59751  ORF Transcript_23798/g.59751 Transcript_23798/m.59751 type:complete len:223 (-) Transcript_23798:1353-2021(-)